MYDGVRFVWLNTYPYYKNDWRRAVNMLSFAVRLLNSAVGLPKPVAVTGCSVHRLAALAARKFSSRYKAKFLFEERDLWPQVLIDMGKLSK